MRDGDLQEITPIPMSSHLREGGLRRNGANRVIPATAEEYHYPGFRYCLRLFTYDSKAFTPLAVIDSIVFG